MASLNRATLIGNIGKDPEIKTLQNGRKFVSFSLATSKRYRDNGIVKGTQLYIEGEITNRSWTDQTTGQKRYTTEINVSSFQILSSRNTQGTSGNGANQQTRPQQAYNPTDEDYTDLPF